MGLIDNAPAQLTERPSVVVISDWIEGFPTDEAGEQGPGHSPSWDCAERPWPQLGSGIPDVRGGYLERLPLALVAIGAAEQAEIWHHWRGHGPAPFRRESPWLARRAFRLERTHAPYASAEMVAFIHRFGAPHILVVIGLGVDPEILAACGHSVILYNSIDAPALRVPVAVSERFDLVITGAQWQSDVVTKRHPGMPTIVLPIGPEFAAPEQFSPLGTAKDVDLVYVAALLAQSRGVPVEGVCLYPVLDHPGWDDGRYCPNGLIRCSSESEARSFDPGLWNAVCAALDNSDADLFTNGDTEAA